MPISTTVFTVDPGAAGTGVAIWESHAWDYGSYFNINQKRKQIEVVKPIQHLVKRHKTQEVYFDWFVKLMDDFNCRVVYCEKPAYMGASSEKGQMVAEKGDLVTLSAFVGSLRGVTWLSRRIPFYLVDVVVWKGTLDKEIIKDKIRNVWPECGAKSHDWDAIGIGMYLLGMINNPKRKNYHGDEI